MIATPLMLSSTATPPLTLPEITEDATVETAFTPVTTPNPRINDTANSHFARHQENLHVG